jgi:hypothetical protein
LKTVSWPRLRKRIQRCARSLSCRVTWWVCEKNGPKCCPNHFCQIDKQLLYVEKGRPKICAVSLIFIKLPSVNNCPICEKTPGLVTLLIGMYKVRNLKYYCLLPWAINPMQYEPFWRI